MTLEIRQELQQIDIIEKSIYNIDSKICGIIDDYKVLQDSQKVADYVIQFLRTYLEHIAARIYAHENPNKQVPIRGKDKWYTQYMKPLKENNEYGYIWNLHHSLQITTSHYVPAEDGAIRLMEDAMKQGIDCSIIRTNETTKREYTITFIVNELFHQGFKIEYIDDARNKRIHYFRIDQAIDI